jgi:hypothetical protein
VGDGIEEHKMSMLSYSTLPYRPKIAKPARNINPKYIAFVELLDILKIDPVLSDDWIRAWGTN